MNLQFNSNQIKLIDEAVENLEDALSFLINTKYNQERIKELKNIRKILNDAKDKETSTHWAICDY